MSLGIKCNIDFKSLGIKFMTTQLLSPIERAVLIAGGQSAVARAIGISPQAVKQWVDAKQVPHKRVQSISKLSGISLSELRPDIYPAEIFTKSARKRKT